MSRNPSSTAPATAPLPQGLVEPDAKVSSATFVAFTEGPAADASGSVYFSDIINNRIMKLSAEGKLSVFRADSGRTNGNIFDREGRLVSCEGSEMGPGGRRRPPGMSAGGRNGPKIASNGLNCASAGPAKVPTRTNSKAASSGRVIASA